MKDINIWGNSIPGNCSKNKVDRMNIIPGHRPYLPYVFRIEGDKFKDTQKNIDTYTYRKEILKGLVKTTFEDEPVLQFYPAKESHSAMIVVPGGGYVELSSDTSPSKEKQLEGSIPAHILNDKGINAFVLRYRINPYEHPYPLLDLQRAVRYLKAHANEYDIDPNKIGVVGYSAGGFSIAALLNILKDRPVNEILKEYHKEIDYVEDEIDHISSRVACAGLFYPVTTYQYNVPMLFAAFDGTLVRNESQRNEILGLCDCTAKVADNLPPQFITYGTGDHIVSCKGTQTYIQKLIDEHNPCTIREIARGEHGLATHMELRVEFADWAAAILNNHESEK